MKKLTIYKLDIDDPSLRYVSEAFNRLPMFQPSEEHPAMKSRHKVMASGEFQASDITNLSHMLNQAADAGMEAAKLHPSPVRKSIEQAADNARESATQLVEWFFANC